MADYWTYMYAYSIIVLVQNDRNQNIYVPGVPLYKCNKLTMDLSLLNFTNVNNFAALQVVSIYRCKLTDVF